MDNSNFLRKPIKSILLNGFIGFCLSLIAILSYADITGRVVGISDGDTIKILSNNQQYTVRLAWIDAPEKNQAFGTRSKDNLAKYIFNKQVTVTSTQADNYGRLLGVVYLNNANINAIQVKDGMAWAYRYYINQTGNPANNVYITLENQARLNRVGLWSDKNPIEPYKFRKGH